MKVGDEVRIQPRAWNRYVLAGGPPVGGKFNPGVVRVTSVLPDGRVLLDVHPDYFWVSDDLLPVPQELSEDAQEITRAFCLLSEVWSLREDSDFGPQFAEAYDRLARVLKRVNPEVYRSMFREGTPDAPLPPDPSTVPGPVEITDLDEVRIRMGAEYKEDAIAYVEAVWGSSTYAFNAAIRDLEAMRRGSTDKTLRRPVTYHEGSLLVLHVRALANDLARNFGIDNLIRDEDDHVRS